MGKSNLDRRYFRVINTITDEFEDDPGMILEGIKVVILGGSAQYDLSKDPAPIRRAIKKTQRIFDYLLEHDVPTLGVCFGYQLIAHKLGASVVAKEEMAETGTVRMRLTDAGREDPIFNRVSVEDIDVQMGHKDSVIDLPSFCTLLGYTDATPVSAYRYKQNIYGVQCHPELASADIRYRLVTYPEYTRGADVDEIMKHIRETPEVARLIEVFINHYTNLQQK